MKAKNIFSLIIVGVLVILIVAGLFYVRMPYIVSTYAKVKPAKQWMLMRGRDGEIISRLFNFENALNEEYAVTNVSRGDRASFVFNKNTIKGLLVSL